MWASGRSGSCWPARRSSSPAHGPRRRRRGSPGWLPVSQTLRRLLLLSVVAVLLPRRAAAAATADAGGHEQQQQPQQPQQQQGEASLPSPPHRVTVVGSGNFGSAVARLLARNVLALPHLFAPDVRMWVFEETVSQCLSIVSGCIPGAWQPGSINRQFYFPTTHAPRSGRAAS